MSQKPRSFAMRDLMLLVPAILSLTLTALFWTVQFENPRQAFFVRVSSSLCSILFSLIGYFAIRAYRKKMQRFVWIPTHNIFLDVGGMDISESHVKLIHDRVIHTWQNEIKWPIQDMLSDQSIFISFRRLPLMGPEGRSVLGYPVPRSFEVVVGINDGDDVHDTTLEHELNHIFYGHFTKNWDEEFHHGFFRDHGFK